MRAVRRGGRERSSRNRWRGLLAVAVLGTSVASVGTTAPPGAPKSALVALAVDPPPITFDGESGTLDGVSTSAGASVSSTAAKRGSGGLRIASSSAPGYARWQAPEVAQGHGYASVRSWVRVLGRGPGESVDLITVGNTAGSAHFDLFVNGNNQRFQWDLWREDTDQTAYAVEYDRWYLVELLVEFEGSTHTARVRIDGEDQGTITTTRPDSAVQRFTLGTVVDKTHTQHYDDVELRVGDEPFGWPADTPPSVSLRTPGASAAYGIGEVVPADFSCSGGDHPVVSCVGTVADGAAIDTGAGEHGFTVTATDRAGYVTRVTRTYTAVDRTDPTVEVLAPGPGAVYARRAPVTVRYSCVDDIALAEGGCTGDVPSGAPLDTGTLGEHDLTVSASDAAGNTTSVTRSYRVVPNRPDGLIRTATSTRFAGDGVYNANGSRQVLLGRAARGRSVRYVVRIQNDGGATDTFRVRGTPPDARWSVRYLLGTRDVSAAVTSGRLQMADLPPGRSRVVQVVVQPKPGARPGAVKRVLVTTMANGPAPVRDAVGVAVRRT